MMEDQVSARGKKQVQGAGDWLVECERVGSLSIAGPPKKVSVNGVEIPSVREVTLNLLPEDVAAITLTVYVKTFIVREGDAPK